MLFIFHFCYYFLIVLFFFPDVAAAVVDRCSVPTSQSPFKHHTPLPSTTVIHQRALLTISAATFLCSYMKQRGRGGRGTRSSISIHVPHTRFLWPDLASRVAHYCSGSSPLSPQRMKRERKGGGVTRSTGLWQVHNGKQ